MSPGTASAGTEDESAETGRWKDLGGDLLPRNLSVLLLTGLYVDISGYQPTSMQYENPSKSPM